MSFSKFSIAQAPLRRSLSGLAAALAIGYATASVVSGATTQAPPIAVDGSAVSVPALERNRQIFVPVRGVFEKLGAHVAYTPPASIVASKNGKELAHLAVGSRTAMVDGVSHRLAAAPFESHGHVMVPLRLISEAAGASVTYMPNPRAVRITRAAVAAVVAAAPAVAAEPVASAAPVTAEQHGIPWWVWLLAALVILGIIFALMRRKKEPIITTSSTGRSSDPKITTRR